MYGGCGCSGQGKLQGPHRLGGSRVTKLTHGSRLASNLRHLLLCMSTEMLRAQIPIGPVPSEDAEGALWVSQEALRADPTLGEVVWRCFRF